MSSIAALEALRAQVIQQIDELLAENEQNRRNIATENRKIATSTSQEVIDRARVDIRRYEATIRVNQASIARFEIQLAEINREIAALQQLPVQSSGATTLQAAQARDNNAASQSPPVPSLFQDALGQVTTPPPAVVSNAQKFQLNLDVGTDGRIRKPAETQATPPFVAAPGAPLPNNRTVNAPTTRGVSAGNDDSSVRSRLNVLFDPDPSELAPQANVLDAFASYTYNISIYLMSPDNYNYLLTKKQKNIPGWQLLMRSGGAPSGVSSPIPVDPQELAQEQDGISNTNLAVRNFGRNQFFPLDFYIDDVMLRALCPGKGSAGAHNVVELSFKVTEPNGITFLDNLREACSQYVGPTITGQEPNYAAQNYLMVVRFYGYDINGNLISGDQFTSPNSAPGSEKAIIEKYIPFQFTAIKFRVASRVVEYQCNAVCPQNVIGTGQARGVIPYNVELTGKTLKDLFTGSGRPGTGSSTGGGAAGAGRNLPSVGTDTEFERSLGGPAPGFDVQQYLGLTPSVTVTAGTAATQNQAPAKASAAPSPVVTQSITDALNQYQAQLVKDNIYGEADEYAIEIVDPIIGNASIVPPGQTELSQKAMGPSSKAPANQQKNPATGKVETDTKNTSAMAGTSIVQFIDQYTRASSYIYSQQKFIIDPRTGEQIPQPVPANQVLAWYRIGIQAEPLKYDTKRNDYAYRITYQLSPYKINDLQSDFFPKSQFQGVQKKYDYWFTGQNTQILDFSQDFNYLYYLVINTKNPTDVTGQTTDYREYLKKTFQPNSNQSSQGAKNDVNEPSANAADYLYSPGDQSRVKIKILGDPAWIQQGELWSGIAGIRNFNYRRFLDDGTINYESQEALFELAFNKPADYDLETGLLDPGQKNYGANRADGNPGSATQSYIYKAVEVTSMFSKGQFTQDLVGVLIQFPLPSTKQETTLPQVESAASTVGRNTTLPTNPVSFAGSEFGAYFGDGDTGGEVNYRPRGLSTVIDSQRPQNPLATDSLAAEGFALPQSPPEPATSEGQVVGPASSSAQAVRSLGGSSGLSVGPPSATLVLISGATRTVTDQRQILSLLNQGMTTNEYAQRASRELKEKQDAANAPTTNSPPQLINKENG